MLTAAKHDRLWFKVTGFGLFMWLDVFLAAHEWD
jgi:hypothetical protein